ncbi:MAG: oligosaccharide flippase family protein [Candidatus Pacearchaeota archaeon]|jgi:O-antigen/teichoic acid export membrane protein
MIKRFNELRKNDLVRGSLILFFFMNLFNLLNYVFQATMARLLSLSQFGTFAALMGIIYLFSFISDSVQLVSSKYTSIIDEKKSPGKVKTMIFKMTKRGMQFSLFAFVLYLLSSFLISWFLKIEIGLVIMTGSVLFLVFITPINRGVLQSKKSFSSLGLSFFIESLIKVIVGIFLVYLGYGVYGAMGGVIFGILFSFALSFFFIKDIIKHNYEKTEFPKIYPYSFSVIIFMFIILFMFSVDIFLAKRFFSEDIAGLYATASLTGKIIFMFTSPVSRAMFPLTSENKNNNRKKTLLNSFKIVILIGVFLLFIFLVAPKIIISVLFGEKYLEISGLLFIVGLSFLLLSFSNLLIYYLLSKKVLKKTYYLILFPIIQIILLSIFNDNLKEFSIALLFSFVILFLGILLFIKKIDKS